MPVNDDEVQEVLRALAERREGLGPREMQLFDLLTKHKSVPLSEATEALGVHPRTMGLIAKRLYNQRLIERVSDRDDTRVVNLRITPRGTSVYQKMRVIGVSQ